MITEFEQQFPSLKDKHCLAIHGVDKHIVLPKDARLYTEANIMSGCIDKQRLSYDALVISGMLGVFDKVLTTRHQVECAHRIIEDMFIDKQKVKEIIDSVLKWWKEHQFDVVCNEEDEYNVYEDGTKPEFVEIALKIKEDLKQNG